MALQEEISLQANEQKVGNTFKVLIDRREGDYYIGRTEFDSPEVDDEVVVESDRDLHAGEFVQVMITDAMEHDLVAVAKP